MLRFVQIRNNHYENRLIFFTFGEYEYCISIRPKKNICVFHKKYGCCFYKEKLHTNGFCLFCFSGLQEEFSTLPCSLCFTSKFWLLLADKGGVQQFSKFVY
jgi:hypothetical protein